MKTRYRYQITLVPQIDNFKDAVRLKKRIPVALNERQEAVYQPARIGVSQWHQGKYYVLTETKRQALREIALIKQNDF